MKIAAIIGATASGKSALAHKIAHKTNATLLSLDSLALYKNIDILSAKPTPYELREARYFGIDVIEPNAYFSALLYFDIFHKAYIDAKERESSLIIVGGSSFYLKALLEGFSTLPSLSATNQHTIDKQLQDIKSAYQFLSMIDPLYAKQIAPNDRYRIKKALAIYYETKEIPSQYFKAYPPQGIINQNEIEIFDLFIEREELRKRISLRTDIMFDLGAIDEVTMLEQIYGRAPKSMQSIGIKEILDYLDAKMTLAQTKECINIHTAQLAKRQSTFNKSQFQNTIKDTSQGLEEKIMHYLDCNAARS